MQRKRKKRLGGSVVETLLRKILVTQLTIAKVRQGDIAKIAGMSKGDVNAIARHIKPAKK